MTHVKVQAPAQPIMIEDSTQGFAREKVRVEILACAVVP